MSSTAHKTAEAFDKAAVIDAILQNLQVRGCDGYCYLSLQQLTTTTAPGFDNPAVVDYVYLNELGQLRLFDENDAGHNLIFQDLDLLTAILEDLRSNTQPNGYVRVE